MGRQQAGQASLFYAFSLEDHVPANHFARDRPVPRSERTAPHLAPHYRHMGRPSIEPVLMIRMLIVGYCFGIRSERRLCDEVHLNLAYRWFCGLGLEGAIPDHSTRQARVRNGPAALHSGKAGGRRRVRYRCQHHQGRRIASASCLTLRCSGRKKSRRRVPCARPRWMLQKKSASRPGTFH